MSHLRMGIAALALAFAFDPASAQTTAPSGQNVANPPVSGGTAPSDNQTVAASSAKTDAQTPPLAGANSFTETQAKDRIQKAGFNNVSSLSKDPQGVWRGKAQKSGQEVSIALDYRGNVVQK